MNRTDRRRTAAFFFSLPFVLDNKHGNGQDLEQPRESRWGKGVTRTEEQMAKKGGTCSSDNNSDDGHRDTISHSYNPITKNYSQIMLIPSTPFHVPLHSTSPSIHAPHKTLRTTHIPKPKQ